MLNRGASSLYDEEESGLLGMAWQVDRYPLVRLGVLLVWILVPLSVIGWRVAQLQLQTAPVYAREFARLTERTEEIPCLDGRIFSSDGQILAQDVPGLEVAVHYRWIEEPPDPQWLKQKAQQRLTRQERRKPERLRAELDKLIVERAQLWQQLADMTATPLEEIAEQRRKIQARILRMQKSAARQRASAAEQTAQIVRSEASTTTQSLQDWLIALISTPEETRPNERVVLQEELDYYTIITGITPAIRSELKTHPEKYPNLRVKDITHREYPQGGIAPHVIGFRKPLGQDEWQKRQMQFPDGDPLGYQPGDRIGQMGIERFHEGHLRGVRGLRKVVTNSQGEMIEEQELRAPRPGHDLEVTLNLQVQATAEKILAGAMTLTSKANTEIDESAPTEIVPKSGCIAVMDVRTGELIVAASWPSFDINTYITGDSQAILALESDPRRPLYSRLHQMTLPPGSVFKAVTATAMLQSGMNGHQPFYCQGYLDVPTKKRCLPFVRYGTCHADVDLSMALAQSCNVYFYHAAREMGAPALLDWSARFGFGKMTGIDLPGESAGNLPSGRCDHLSVAIGQERLIVTPLQVVRMMAAIANGGNMLTPRVARHTGSSLISDGQTSGSGKDLLAAAPGQPIPEISTAVLQQVRQGLEQVVANPRGTGYKTVRLPEITVAGKSGTAEANGGPNHAWFAGYVPAERPKYSFVVVLERGGAGGKAAGPLAKQLVQSLISAGLVDTSRHLTGR